jgi:hypothetical protein
VCQEFGLPAAMRTDNGVPFASAWALYGFGRRSPKKQLVYARSL